MHCKNCGQKVNIGSRFCKNCDFKLKPIKIPNGFKNYSKELLIVIFIAVIIFIYWSYNQPSNKNLLPYTTPTIQITKAPIVNNLDKNNIKSIVVDILCDNKNAGSGTIFLTEGYILTNNHVISGSTFCFVSLPDSSTGAPLEIYYAKPIIIPTLSKQYDIAMLKIYEAYTDKDGKSWGTFPKVFPSYTPPSDCTNLSPQLGDSVIIYGYPVTSGGYYLTITEGIISSFSENNYILTSAKVDSGNSGGLAVYQNGCFLGIPSAVVSGNYQNLGVIIPSYIIGDFADKVKTQQNTITP